MTKARIIDKGLETIILKERNTLAKFDSPFVISLLCSFQDKNNLFFLLELLSGGDLQYHLMHYNYYFTESQLKFFLTNVILGLEYIHRKGIVHCNISPENIMFDSRGFAKIIGFGDSCPKDKHPDSKAIAMDESSYDAGIAQKEIKSGVTLENCQAAYVLESDSPVEFEVSELISFSDEHLEKTFEVQ